MIWKYNTIKALCSCIKPDSIRNFTILVPYNRVGKSEDYAMMDLVLVLLRPLGFKAGPGVSIESHGVISKDKIKDILITLNQELK